MANLRDLIDYTNRSGIQTSQSLPAVVGRTAEPISSGIATAFAPHFPGSAYRQIKYHNPCVQCYNCCTECFYWRAPLGTTFIKFEIWGGGGSGAGSCCCGFGSPGGSGAYAVKCICTGFDLGGCVYEMCVAGGGCVNPDPVGYRGCKTYIQGYGLDNFCAEGGASGRWICMYSIPCVCDYGGAGGFVIFDGQGGRLNTCALCMTTGDYSINGCWNNCTWMQSGISCLRDIPGSVHGTGMQPNFEMWDNRKWCQGRSNTHHDLVGAGTTFGSCGKRVNYRHHLNPCYGGACWNCLYCAPFYGADFGARGLPGLVGSPCNHDADNYCMVNQYVPYPGGLINTRGGYIIRRNSDMNVSGNNGHPYDFGEYFGYAATNLAHGSIPGWGGRTAVSHAGNCYCGGYGGSGQVIITYG